MSALAVAIFQVVSFDKFSFSDDVLQFADFGPTSCSASPPCPQAPSRECMKALTTTTAASTPPPRAYFFRFQS
jgi:hypothetical protein